MESTPRSSGRVPKSVQPVTADLPAPWGPVPLPEGDVVHRTIGPMEFWLRRIEGEIRLASAPVAAEKASRIEARGRGARRKEPSSPPPAEPEAASPETPEARPKSAGTAVTEDQRPPDAPAEEKHQGDETSEPTWSRWAPQGNIDEVFIQPVLPDRPLVLEPEVPFTLLPGAEARVYVRVPLSARVQLPTAEGDLTLQEIPTVVLSDTWWGDFLEGELSYWLHTTARRLVSPELLEPHLAICPLHLVNQSGGELKVEKLTLRVAHLSLFVGGSGTGGFWADVSRVRYQGDAEGSQIDMSGTAPEEADGGRLVTPPREPRQRSFRSRTFARLRGLPGIGL